MRVNTVKLQNCLFPGESEHCRTVKSEHRKAAELSFPGESEHRKAAELSFPW